MIDPKEVAQALVATLTDPQRAALDADLVDGIELLGLRVQPTDALTSRGAGGWCDGASITSSGLILYRPTRHRRQNFTLAHEVGHHLIDADWRLRARLADEDDAPRLRERVCDHVAAALLVPTDRVDAALGGAPPSVAALASLYEATRASWSACTVALAARLPCDGFIALVDMVTGRVHFSARARDTRPYTWRDDTIPAGHHLRVRPVPAKAESWWTVWDGTKRTYYMVAEQVTETLCAAVLAEDDLWQVTRLHLPRPVDEDRGYTGTTTCPTCNYQGPTRWYPCTTCGVAQCPRCEECECERRARRHPRGMCTGCFVTVRADQLVDGLCSGCR